MTLPHERTRAVLMLDHDIRALAKYMRGKGEHALVPRKLIQAACLRLRHYPTSFDIDRAAEKAPEVFALTKDVP